MNEELENLIKRLNYIEEEYIENNYISIGKLKDIKIAINLISRQQKELQLKDKVIKLMAERIKKENYLIKEWCNTQNCTYEITNCNEECIKKYFINKAKEEM